MSGEIHEIDKRGEEYLTLLGLADIINQPMINDKTVLAKDFLQFCAQYAIPAFEAFKTLDPSSEQYKIKKEALTNMVTGLVKPIDVE